MYDSSRSSTDQGGGKRARAHRVGTASHRSSQSRQCGEARGSSRFRTPGYFPSPSQRQRVTSKAPIFYSSRNSAAASPEQIGPNPDEATTRERLKGVKSTGARSAGGKPAIGGRNGGKASVVPLPGGRATGPLSAAACGCVVRGTALLGATCSRVRGIGLLSRRVVRGITLLGERERGGSKCDPNREAQSFHAGHFVFSFPPDHPITPPDEPSFLCQIGRRLCPLSALTPCK